MLIIKTTTNSTANADLISSTILDSRLAACIQVTEINSTYIWNNKQERNNELEISIKTKAANFDKIESIIKKLSNYKLPQIIAVPVANCSKEYKKWAYDNC